MSNLSCQFNKKNYKMPAPTPTTTTVFPSKLKLGSGAPASTTVKPDLVAAVAELTELTSKQKEVADHIAFLYIYFFKNSPNNINKP